MPAKSVAVTSPLTGPFTIWQIFLRFSLKSPGSLASSVGLVVTPSMMPIAASVSMSLMLPESMNSFMVLLTLRNLQSSEFRVSEIQSLQRQFIIFDRVPQLADAVDLDRDAVAVRAAG